MRRRDFAVNDDSEEEEDGRPQQLQLDFQGEVRSLPLDILSNTNLVSQRKESDQAKYTMEQEDEQIEVELILFSSDSDLDDQQQDREILREKFKEHLRQNEHRLEMQKFSSELPLEEDEEGDGNETPQQEGQKEKDAPGLVLAQEWDLDNIRFNSQRQSEGEESETSQESRLTHPKLKLWGEDLDLNRLTRVQRCVLQQQQRVLRLENYRNGNFQVRALLKECLSDTDWINRKVELGRLLLEAKIRNQEADRARAKRKLEEKLRKLRVLQEKRLEIQLRNKELEDQMRLKKEQEVAQAHKHWLLKKFEDDRSFFYFYRTHWIRVMCNEMLSNAYFQYFMFIVVLVYTVAFMFFDPLGDPNKFPNEVIIYGQNIIMMIFWFENLSYFIAKGVALHPDSFLRSSIWNLVEFVLNILGALNFYMEDLWIEAFLAFRILRIISYVKEIQTIVYALYRSLPIILKTLAFLICFLLLFSSTLVKTLKGKQYNCVNSPVSLDLIISKTDCFDYGGDWVIIPIICPLEFRDKLLL